MPFAWSSSYIEYFFFCSGVCWIPYTGFLLYLTYEHYTRAKFPQDFILLLLTLSAGIRCTWYFLYNDYASFITVIILNRVAILFQFAAISILMTMWVRALIITSIADKIHRNSLSQQNAVILKGAADASGTLIRPSQTGTLSQPHTSQPHTPQPVKMNTLVLNLRRAPMSVEKVRELEEKHQQAVIKFETEKLQQHFVFATMTVNFIVWAIILGSLAQRLDSWYEVNLICIGVLCLLEAVVTLVIGFRVAFLLQKELSPVFQAGAGTYSADTTATGAAAGTKGLCAGLVSLYALFNGNVNKSLQLQRDVLKTVINVTMVIFVFFLLRSVAFCIYPVMEV